MFQNVGRMFLEKHYQLIASLSATLSVISVGMHYGWASPIIPFLHTEESHIKISHEDDIWLEMAHFIGSIAFLPINAIFTDKLGRKYWILICSSINLAVWIIMALAQDTIGLYVARFLTGVCANLLFIVIPIYASEISEPSFRGLHVALIDVLFWLGILIMYSTGPFTAFYVPSIIGIVSLVIQMIIFWFMPESPYFLIFKGREEAAKVSLQKFRRNENVDIEHESIANALRIQNEANKNRDLKKLIFKKSTLKTFFIVTILNFSQHFTGFVVILMNLHTILEEADSIYIAPNYTSIIFAALSLIAVTIGSLFVDRFGRKILLIFSSLITGVCVLALAVFLHLKNLGFDTSVHSWIPVVAIFIFAVSFNMGLAVVTKVVASELFPTEIKAMGMCYSDGMFVIMGLLSLLFYSEISGPYGTYVPFYAFAGVALFTIVFTVCVIQETKKQSLLEIQASLQK